MLNSSWFFVFIVNAAISRKVVLRLTTLHSQLTAPKARTRHHISAYQTPLVSVFPAIYANDFGCSLDALGVRESIHEAQNWSYGDTYFILDRPLQTAVDFLAQGLEVGRSARTF